ncbi:trichohyalin-like [Pocillopora damicornis]|nr:trichohyalin-like [Pocillopora damicornis]
MLELVSLSSVCYVPLLLKKLRETSVNHYRYTGRFMNVHLSKKSLGDNKPSDKYPEAFREAIRSTSIQQFPTEGGQQLLDHYAAHAGCGLSKLHPAVALNSLRADSEFNISLPAAGETRLKALRKAESKRQQDKCMDELKTVLERVRLAMDEFNTAQAELEVPESPDLEYEAEEEEKRQRKKKLKRKRRREQRKIRHKKASSKETLKGREKNAEEKSAKSEKESGSSSDEGDEDSGEEKEKNAEENSAESDEESGSSSDVGDEDSGEDEDNDEDQGAEEEDRQGENWTMTGQIKRKVSQRMLVKQSKRRRVQKLITSYMDLCIEREDIIRQMQSWIESTVDEELLKPARIFLFSPDLLLDDLPLGLTSDMQAHGNTLVRLKGIADSLGIGTGSTEDESDESTPQVKGQKGLRIVKRFSNVEELDIGDNWIQVQGDVDKILEHAIKTVPVRTVRLNLEVARKYFSLMTKLMTKRNETIHQLDEKIVDLECNVVKSKKQNEELRKNNKKAKVKAEKLQYQNQDLQNNVKELQNMINNLNEKLDAYKKKESHGLFKSSSESMASSKESIERVSVVSLVDEPSQQLAPTGEKVSIQTPKPSKSKVVIESDSRAPVAAPNSEESKKEISQLRERLERIQDELKVEKEKSTAFENEFVSLQSEKVKVEQERSELEIKLENIQREHERAVEESVEKLEDLERENKRMTGEIECNEEMIKYQEERLGQFMEEIQSLEERMMSFPPTPATMSVASMAGATRRERRKTSLQLGLEPQTARQMVAKVKQQYEAELQSLKDHQAKENQRHQAELRRLEQEHKKDLQNIHKESLQLLRALNRFKDGVASLLDRENMGEEAHNIRCHAPLPLDENFGDTRQMLARMAILANEMMISVELQLSRGLMSKRLESKDPHMGRMDQSTERKMPRDHGSIARRGTLGQLRIDGKQVELHVWKLLEEGNRQEVMEVVKELQTKVSEVEQTVEKVKKVDEEKIQKKESQLQRVLRRESETRKSVDEQKSIIKNLAAIWKSRRIGQKYIRREDQQRNLELLQQAMKEDQISKELYESTTKLIKQAMDYPRKRFIELVERYVYHRRVKEIQENVQKMREESNINERVLLAMKDAEERMIRAAYGKSYCNTWL